MNAERKTDRLRVLVVDDTQLNRQLLSAMLTKMGHSVTLAANGAEGLELFESTQPDLVLLDVSMPVMDGFEVARVIRRSNVWVQIFFISARTGNEDVLQGLHAGGDDYLFKPVNYEILQSKIQTFQSRLAMSAKVMEQNQRLLDYRERTEDETGAAREFIKQFIAMDKIDEPLVHYFLKPAERNFSGDLIAVARTPDNRLHVLLADSAGHGLTSALAVIPITQPFYQMTAKGFYVPAIMREINRRVHDYLPLPRFVAAIMLSLDMREQTLQVWNGGCPGALLISPDGKELIHQFKSQHLPLGVVTAREFDAKTEFYKYTEHPGHLLMCSDGATEVTMKNGLSLDQSGLLTGALRSSADHLFERLVEAIDVQLGGDQPDDDIALILVDCLVKEIEPQQKFVPIFQKIEVVAEVHCDTKDESAMPAKPEWQMSVMLTAGQLKRLDVVPFLLGIAGQIEGGKSDGKLFMVISELFNNALDHGVLKLDSVLKNHEEGMEQYYEERALRLEELEHGQIAIQIEKLDCQNCGCLKVTLKDSGEGFDHARCVSFDPELNRRRHGRGIALLMGMCSKLEYSGNGSEVVAYLNTSTC